MNNLQKALSINAIFSTCTGAILSFSPNYWSTFFEVGNATFFRVLGILLLFFSASIAYEIKHLRSLAVRWIIIQDLLWVVGSIILLLIPSIHISFPGRIAIGIVALIVFVMAINQSRALRVMKI